MCNLNGFFQLVGVVARGNGCGEKYPGVYTAIPSFMDWINQVRTMY